MSETGTSWQPIRKMQTDGFLVTVGRIRHSAHGWIAYDDRHGPRRISVHADWQDARDAVLFRAERSAEDLDREVASIVDALVEIRHLKAELEQQPKADRVAEILARANQIGRLWE